MMKLKFLAVSFEHFSCGAINLKKGEVAEFTNELGANLLRDYPSDLVEVETSAAPKDKDFSAQDNKMAKKTAKFKSK